MNAVPAYWNFDENCREATTFHARCLGSGLETMPFQPGNNVYLCVTPESREETGRLFTAPGDGVNVTMPLGDQFRGAYSGMLEDRFGMRRMFHLETPRGWIGGM